MTLAEFLLARIDAEEQMATAAGHGCGYLHEHNAGWLEVDLPDEHNARPGYDMRFIRAMSPRKVIAECKAKRRIVKEARDHETCGGGYDECSEAALLTLRHLSTPYADHPDYDDSWRP